MSVGLGSTISTMSRMMWRGVRNCPFCPAVAILPSMYSYRSPLVSRSSMGTLPIMSTTLASNAAVGIVKRAPSMCFE